MILSIETKQHPEYGYTIVINKEIGEEVDLDFEWFSCDCGYPARMVGVSCYSESYKCDKCGNKFQIN